MTYEDYNTRREEFRTTLGHGDVLDHLHKLTDKGVKLTRWRTYFFVKMSPRQIKRISKVVNRRIAAARTREDKKKRARAEYYGERGEAFQEARETIAA